jgi:hypothetical protein
MIVRISPANETKKTKSQINLDGFEFANAITKNIIEITVKIRQIIPIVIYKAITAII